MNCLTCKVNKIGPTTAPYGGFLCVNEHLQCNACNTLKNGKCGICENETKFVQMNFNPCSQTLASDQNRLAMSAVGQEPTAPPLLPSNSNLFSIHQGSSSFFPRSLIAEIETQSSLSQEHLSMKDSKESLEQTANKRIGEGKETHELHEEKSAASSVAISNEIINEEMRISNEQAKPLMGLDENSATNFSLSSHVNVNNCDVLNAIKPDKKKHSHRRRCRTSRESGLNENEFLFEEDPLDSNIINTSEIRFMDSTDSLHNFYSNSTPQGTNLPKTKEFHKQFPLKSCPEQLHNVEPPTKALSTKVLHDFETLNTANRSEVVENYLETYGPMGFDNFPAYNCQHQLCDFGQQQMAAQKRTVCVSTDSDPSLKNINVLKTTAGEESQPAKFKPQEFVVMQSMGIGKPECGNITLMDKFGRPSLDMRMQKILETFQEDPQIPKIKEKPIEQSKGNYMKIPFTAAAAAATENPETIENSTTSPKELQKTAYMTNNVTAPNSTNNNVVVLQLLNSHRAFYNPPESDVKSAGLAQAEAVAQEPPSPQFQTIPCSPSVAQELMVIKSRYLNSKPVPAYTLNIPRSPIRCPQSNCQRMIFVSDFNKHLVVDHSHLPMERIEPFQCKNFFLDPRLAHCGLSKCHLLFLMRDTISDLGSSQYKDFLPLLVMSTRISLTQICGLTPEQQGPQDRLEFFIIWVTGIVPEEFPISVSLTIWPRSGKVPSCHVVYSGEMYSIRKSQQALDVWQSGRMLLLSTQEIDLLTDGGREMLNLQLIVH